MRTSPVNLIIKNYSVGHFRLQPHPKIIARHSEVFVGGATNERRKSRYNRLHCSPAGAANMRVEPKKRAEEWEDVDAVVFKNTIKTRDRPAVLRGPGAGFGRRPRRALNRRTRSPPISRHSTAAMLRLCSKGPASIEGRFFYNDTLDGFQFRGPKRGATQRCTGNGSVMN